MRLTYLQQRRYEMIDGWFKDPKNVLEFCKEKGICEKTFYQWRTRYLKYKEDHPSPIFMKIEPENKEEESVVIQIEYPNGVKVSVYQNLQEETLKKLVNLI